MGGKSRKTPHAASSQVQRELEPVLLDRICQLKFGSGFDLKRDEKVATGGGSSVVIDGWVKTGKTLFALELYSSVGGLKPGQKRKLRADLLKLVLVQKVFEPVNVQGIVVVTTSAAKEWLKSKAGWTGAVLAAFDIKVWLVELRRAELARLTAAHERQSAAQRRDRAPPNAETDSPSSS